MRNIRWSLLLGSALIFGVAIILVYGISKWWSFGSSTTTGYVLSVGMVMLLWLIPYIIAKKVLSNSVARRSEAGVLGVILSVTSYIVIKVGDAVLYAIDHPVADWIKNFNVAMEWDTFFLELFIPTRWFILALVGFAVFIAYKNTVPIKETPTQPLAKPTDKKISLWITILLLSATLLVMPGFMIFGPKQGGWEGIYLLVLIPILLFACGLTLIVQYAIKLPKVALMVAILMNVLLVVGYGWGTLGLG